MPSFKCPSCHEETLSLGQKYRLGWWMTTHCSPCGARITAFPWTLMALYCLYIWNVVWWLGQYIFNGGLVNFIYMAIGWLLIDLINLYFMPLATLRRKEE